jgi:fumarate hydratase class II
MPGKVNPVILESVTMVCAQIIGNDLSITLAGQSGTLELNTMMPLIAFNLLQSIDIEAKTVGNLVDRCVTGIRANRERCVELAEKSYALVTAIAPLIGYDRAAKIAKKAQEEKITIREAMIAEGMSKEEVERILDLKKMTKGKRV